MEPGGGLDLQQLMAAAAQMQDKLLTAQQELADALVEGTAGGGMVTAVVNGQGELVDLTIDPSVIDIADPQESAQTVADLVLAACRAAYLGVADLQQEKMGPLSGGFGSPGAESGLSGLLGGSGGGGEPGSGGPAGHDAPADEPRDGS